MVAYEGLKTKELSKIKVVAVSCESGRLPELLLQSLSHGSNRVSQRWS